ncbi:uncharacterized protein LOC106064106 isoform X2 [Biomphalaria glabrata]|uniref:Uncharacterized protein LOC106064106 isoform X2 n=1 Tax=Biomphalaria glabrata TaxID=6526 RepID=A0A9W2ZC66_BIOGL|nr:uncharacterized protein LOC106064106 isoform X2 [Biomphalaria glabrata]
MNQNNNTTDNDDSNLESKPSEFAHLFKVLIIGPENVGKTSFLRRYVDDCFSESYISTIGVDFSIATLQSADDQKIKLQIWDTAGQERFRTVTDTYFRGAHGFLVLYNVLDKETFQQLPYWLDMVDILAPSGIALMIVGNKADATNSTREVSKEEVKAFAEARKIVFEEASSKNNLNVSAIFQNLTEMMLQKKHSIGEGHINTNQQKREAVTPNSKRKDQIKDTKGTLVTKPTEHAQFFKVIIIGPENVGKTCFLQRFATKSFTETYLATIGVDFSVSTIQSADGQPIKLQIWDTAGQERFRTITNSYFRGAHGIIVMYDVQNKDTFQQLPYWLDTVERFASSERSLKLTEMMLQKNQPILPVDKKHINTRQGKEESIKLSTKNDQEKKKKKCQI